MPLKKADTTGRWDIYGPVHKGLRRAHAQMIQRLGCADFTGQVDELLKDLRAHIAMAAAHLTDEEVHIHTALESRAPGATALLTHQHDGHRLHMAELEEAIRAVESGKDQSVGRRLYLCFTRFVADDLEHMAEEETQTWPVLCAYFSDAELANIEMTIVSSLPPALSMAFMTAMVPAMNPQERAALLGGIKSGAPSDMYAQLVETAVRPTLPAADFARLEALGLAA